VNYEAEAEVENIEFSFLILHSSFLILPLHNLKSPRIMRNMMTMLILE